MLTRLISAVLSLGAMAFAQAPQAVTVCQLQQNPAAYDRKLVELTGNLSRGFENFTLSDAGCDPAPPVWIEYGGNTSTDVIYCCGRHDGVAEVGGIATPLVRDEAFRLLDRRLRERQEATVRAKLVGHFFAKAREGGYGHMGCCSLFVIERVLAVNAR